MDAEKLRKLEQRLVAPLPGASSSSAVVASPVSESMASAPSQNGTHVAMDAAPATDLSTLPASLSATLPSDFDTDVLGDSHEAMDDAIVEETKPAAVFKRPLTPPPPAQQPVAKSSASPPRSPAGSQQKRKRSTDAQADGTAAKGGDSSPKKTPAKPRRGKNTAAAAAPAATAAAMSPSPTSAAAAAAASATGGVLSSSAPAASTTADSPAADGQPAAPTSPNKTADKSTTSSPTAPSGRSTTQAKITTFARPLGESADTAALADMRTRLDERAKEVERLKGELASASRELSITTDALTKAREADDKRRAQAMRLRQLLVSLLTKQSMELKKAQRAAVGENLARLGYPSMLMTGEYRMTVGSAFDDLKLRQEELTEQKNEVEKQLRAVRRKTAHLTKDQASGVDEDESSLGPTAGSTASSATPNASSRKRKTEATPKDDVADKMSVEEAYEQFQILTLRKAALKKEETELQTLAERLERDRDLHVREIRRLAQEDESVFKHHPVFNDRYLLLHMIGKGGFSEVYKAFDLEQYMEVACKIHQVNPSWTAPQKDHFVRHAIREFQIHQDLSHPRIVRLLDRFEHESTFVTIFEFCEGCDLDQYLRTHKILPEKEARSIITQIVSGLSYLNQLKPPIIHYDLKPANILISNGSCRITDFGLAKVMEDSDGSEGMEQTSHGAGTYWYLPPECFGGGKISPKVDVWSVGVIFYQMLYGERPYGHNMTQAHILKNGIISNAQRVQFPARTGISNEAKAFIEKCLEREQRLRPTVQELAQLEYLRTHK